MIADFESVQNSEFITDFLSTPKMHSWIRRIQLTKINAYLYLNLHVLLLACDLCWGSVTFWYGPDPRTHTMPLTNGFVSGSGSCYFRQWPSRWQRKIKFLPGTKFFKNYFLKLHLRTFFKNKSHKEVTIKEEWRYSLQFLLDDIRIRTVAGSGAGMPQKIWIRLQIRIPNAACCHIKLLHVYLFL